MIKEKVKEDILKAEDQAIELDLNADFSLENKKSSENQNKEVYFRVYDPVTDKYIKKVLTQEIELELIETYNDLNLKNEVRELALKKLLDAYDSYIQYLVSMSSKNNKQLKEDLYLEATSGFTEAVTKFNKEKSNNARIHTYAFSYIKKNFRNFISKLKNPVKGPSNKKADLAKKLITEKRKEKGTLSEEDYNEIAQEMNNLKTKKENSTKKPTKLKTAKDVRFIESTMQSLKSIDESDQFGNPFGDSMSDNNNYLDDFIEEEKSIDIRKIFFEAYRLKLDKREKFIVKHRVAKDFFPEVSKKATLDALAKALGVSIERIRQIEKKAEDKLKLALRAYNPKDSN